jgi:hypothetical protein
MPAVLLGAALAAGPQGPNTDDVSPGLLGFLTVFLLALATVVLVRSMTKHLRKVRYSPGPDGQPWTPPGPVGAAEPVARTPDAPAASQAPDGEEPAPKA